MGFTKKDFEYFKKEFLKVANDTFGMKDYFFNFEFVDLNDDLEMTSSWAETAGIVGNRQFRISLNSNLEGENVPKNEKEKKEILTKAAFHEACECLLYRLRIIAMQREFNEETLDSEIHAVIYRLQNIIGGGSNLG